jgi:hypothetical protein
MIKQQMLFDGVIFREKICLAFYFALLVRRNNVPYPRKCFSTAHVLAPMQYCLQPRKNAHKYFNMYVSSGLFPANGKKIALTFWGLLLEA